MYEAMVLLSCVATALLTVHAQRPSESPCPNLFTYEERSAEADRWYGVILLSTDVELNSVWVEIELDRQAVLLGNWYGEVTSADNKQFTITNRKRVLSPGPATPVRIFVKYIENEPIPYVKRILLNGRKICPNSSGGTTVNRGTNTAIGGGVIHATVAPSADRLQTSDYTTRRTTTRRTTQTNTGNNFQNNNNNAITQSSQGGNRGSATSSTSVFSNGQGSNRVTSSTTVNRPIVNPNAFDNSDTFNVVQPTRRPQYTTTQEYNEWVTIAKPSPVHPDVEDELGFEGDLRPNRKPLVTQRPSQRPNPPNPLRNNQCGVLATTAKPLITHGSDTEEGQWPWHAALYRSAGIDLNYICGGSLVSANYVVTAAHCVAKSHSNQPVNHQFLLIYLGKYSLRVWTNDGIQDIPVEQIILHPQYNYTVFHNDVAVLKLKRPAKYTDYVRPICLWRESPDLSSVLEREGTVVGWGFDENGRISDRLAMAKMPVVSQETCLWSKPEFFSKFATDKTYCAGFRNGTSVCNGDSGGGMVFPQLNTNPPIWQLRGLVSISVALQNISICDPYNYVVFTDLAKHQQWLQAIINYS